MEFDYFLAEQLHMTVGELRATMPNQEWIEWHIYYARKGQRAELERLKAGH